MFILVVILLVIV